MGPETRARLSNWEGKYLNAALNAVEYKQIVVQADSFQTGWVQGSKSGKASVGSQQWSFGSAGNGGNFDQSNLNARYLVGTIKAIRVYKKVLSNAELAANRAIDEARFFTGIPVTNVVVATSVPGVEGNESSGAYAYDDSGHTFTAPQRMVKDGVSYVCAGYTLERRNGAAWDPAQLFAGTAYTSADTNACVRLTWQWRATGGVAGADLDPLLDDYVTDGLLLHVDGIRNVGADKPHDNAASEWCAVLLGHGRVADVAQRLQLNTCKGLLRGLVGHHAVDGHRRILVLDGFTHWLLDGLHFLFFLFVLALCHHGHGAKGECQGAEQQSATHCLPGVKYGALHLHLFLARYSSSSTGRMRIIAMRTSRV